ncbi:copper amine oxidase [Paenibacillus rhizosphaerae]|uniref:Copper amine oxidase n=1 Tax=Paenibacillus rhizosphaerae TaxID=297318 RepID=A0A1R1EEG6_9BACL|nr:stalk domain-containing protein [Paenibacillus rhizosphaerae]OMF50191.1 copper amine oxidase [Paenibacillus rhizosphaerae]
MKWHNDRMGNEHKKGAGKKWMVVSLAGLLFITPVIGSGIPLNGHSIASVASAATAATVTKLSESPVTSGAIMTKYKFTTTRSGKQATALADVIKVDLQNPNVKIDVMNGQDGQLTTKQSTGGMVKETGAVAGVNGDYFNTAGDGAPIGGQVTSGELVSTPSDLKGMYSFAVTKSGTPVIDQFSFDGTVTAQDGSTFPLAGVNKASYTPESGTSNYSHANAMYIYTSAWKSPVRPKNSSTTPVEVLVQNNVITQISEPGGFDFAVPEDGYILRTHGTAAQFVTNHMAVGQTITTDYKLLSKTSGQSLDPANLQMMIGGHTILVNNGAASAFSRDVSSIGGYRARTALGYSKDQRYAYIVAVEKNDNSSGMSLSELQTFMVKVGVWKGMNLDGGGSTTMVDRPLGETGTKLTFDTEYGTTQRSVVNAVGVYTEAPQGSLLGLKISGSSAILIGQQASFQLKGYDTYYNPIDVSSITPTWKSSNGNIVVSGQTVKGVKPGTSTITAVSGKANASMQVKVIGGDDLSALNVGTATAPLKAGSTVSVPVTAVTKDGQSITVPAGSLKWEFIGFKGSVQDDKLTVASVNANTKVGYAIARYNGFSTVVVLSAAGEDMWENFENVTYPVDFTTNSGSQVTGSAQVTQGTGDHANSKVLQLQYDMTAGSGKMYAYAQLNGTSGKGINAAATSMSIDAMGDNSLNWMRAELTDAKGQTVYVDLAKAIDWTGWKTINVDLSSLGIAFPAQLKRLYVVNVEDGQDERAKTGTVAFDNIKFTMPSLSSDAGLPTGKVIMAVGQKSYMSNGQKKSMDAAPVMKNGTTYIPVKYVLDTFGGQATWDSANQRISVLRGGKLMDLTVGKKEYILNGKRKSAEVAPFITQGRTLVPLRLVSEQLGLQVNWEQNTKTITIQS